MLLEIIQYDFFFGNELFEKLADIIIYILYIQTCVIASITVNVYITLTNIAVRVTYTRILVGVKKLENYGRIR